MYVYTLRERTYFQSKRIDVSAPTATVIPSLRSLVSAYDVCCIDRVQSLWMAKAAFIILKVSYPDVQFGRSTAESPQA